MMGRKSTQRTDKVSQTKLDQYFRPLKRKRSEVYQHIESPSGSILQTGNIQQGRSTTNLVSPPDTPDEEESAQQQSKHGEPRDDSHPSLGYGGRRGRRQIIPDEEEDSDGASRHHIEGNDTQINDANATITAPGSLEISNHSITRTNSRPFFVPSRAEAGNTRCYYCLKWFDSLRSLTNHQNTGVHDDKVMCCWKCEVTFTNHLEFVNHRPSQPGAAARKVVCTILDTSNPAETLPRVALKGTRGTCYYCRFDFPSRNDLLAHQLTGVHNDHVIRCWICAMEFDSFEEFRQHKFYKTCCRTRARQDRCRYCFLECTDAESLASHEKSSHQDEKVACHECGLSWIGTHRFDSLLQHFHTSHISPHLHAHSCVFCPERYKNGNLLREHIEKMHRATCQFCGQQFFEDTAALLDHEEACEDRPEVKMCDECHKFIPVKEFEGHICVKAPRVVHELDQHYNAMSHTSVGVFDEQMCDDIEASNIKWLENFKAELVKRNQDPKINIQVNLPCRGSTDETGNWIPCGTSQMITVRTALYWHRKSDHGEIEALLFARCLVCHRHNARNSRKSAKMKESSVSDNAPTKTCSALLCNRPVVPGERYCQTHLNQVTKKENRTRWDNEVKKAWSSVGQKPEISTPLELQQHLDGLGERKLPRDLCKIAKLCLDQSKDVFFVDTEHTDTDIHQICFVNARGEVVLSAVLDRGIGSQQLISRLPNNSATTISKQTIMRFYDQDGVLPKYRHIALRAEALADAMCKAGITSESTIIEWSTNACDIRAIRAHFREYAGTSDAHFESCLFVHHWTSNVPSPCAKLAYLYPTLFPDCELSLETPHFADVDALRLRKIVFRLLGSFNGWERLLKLM